MLIDWFTVGAQAVNFIVLVWLLKRFLYKPVLNAIDAREKRIAGELADANRQKTDAKSAGDALRAATNAFEQERASLLAKATLDAQAQGERLLKEARATAEIFAARRQAALAGEGAELSVELTRLAAAETISIARAALEGLAGADLDVRITEVFVGRVRELDPTSKKSFGASLERSNFECVAYSSFPVAEREKAMIRNALNVTFSADIHLRFETSTRVIGGIEVDAAGQRLSWTIADYLNTLREKLDTLLRTSGSSGTPASTPDDRPAGAQPSSVVQVSGLVAPAAAA